MCANRPRQWRSIEGELLSQQFVPTARPFTVWRLSTTAPPSMINRWSSYRRAPTTCPLDRRHTLSLYMLIMISWIVYNQEIGKREVTTNFFQAADTLSRKKKSSRKHHKYIYMHPAIPPTPLPTAYTLVATCAMAIP